MASQIGERWKNNTTKRANQRQERRANEIKYVKRVNKKGDMKTFGMIISKDRDNHEKPID